MSVASTPRWRRVAQDALVCVLVLLLVVLVATNYEAEPVFTARPTARPATHRFVKRDVGATAGIVVGALIFFGLIGCAWISCQHPNWNLYKCCCKCCGNTGNADGHKARGSWFRQEDKAQADLEMAQVESVMSRFEEEAAEKALAHRRGASYETREMRVPHNGERAGHDRIRSTTRMDQDPNATRGKTKRVENWLKDQTQVHGGGQSQNRSPRPSMDSIELRQPRPVQPGHSQGPSISRLQGDAIRLEESHSRQASQASLHPGDHLAMNYQPNHPQHPTHSRSGSAASARSRSPSPMRSPGKLHKPLPAAPSDETAQR